MGFVKFCIIGERLEHERSLSKLPRSESPVTGLHWCGWSLPLHEIKIDVWPKFQPVVARIDRLSVAFAACSANLFKCKVRLT